MDRTPRFPFFHCWFYRNPFTERGWSLGFYLCPCPDEEHRVGDMVLALAHIEVRFGRGINFIDWSFDPINRPIGHNQPT